MPIFEYRGLDKAGRNRKGVIDSDSMRSARAKLKKDGLFVSEIKNRKNTKAANAGFSFKKFSQGKVPVKDLAMMTRQLATMLKANIPLVDSLSAVADQVENPVLQEAIADCKNMVNEGQSFHKALQKYNKIFNKVFLSMAEAGEISGTLDVILLRLAEFTEAQDELNSKVSSALMYPIIMMVMTTGLLMGLFVFVIPKMVAIFEQSPQMQMPWFTVVIIHISGFMVDYWFLVIIGAIMTVFSFRQWKSTPSGSAQWDAIALKLPIAGPMVRMIAVSRFTRTLATLLTGGVPMVQALDIVRNVVNNEVLGRAIDEARSNITEGEGISGPLKRSEQFPPIVIHMVSIGEKTGELENMLIQVSQAFDFQVKTKIDGITGLLSPVVIVLMGIVIAIIVFAIMIPIMDMSDIAG